VDTFENPGVRVLAAVEAVAQSGLSLPRSFAAVLDIVFQGASAFSEAKQPTSALALGGAAPSGTMLFHAFVFPHPPQRRAQALERHLARVFDVVARPGDPLSGAELRPGDVLIRVARGECWSHVAFVASVGLHRLDQLADAGLRGEGYPTPQPGLYIHVVEIGPRPRSSSDRFARRVGDPSGHALQDTLLLRPLLAGGGTSARNAPESSLEWPEETGSCPDIPEPHRLLRIGSQSPSVREAQRKLNAFHIAELAAGRSGLDGCPLVPDCIFGELTFRATKSFQQRVFPDRKREWDGIIGPKTWAQLDQVRPPAPPRPTPPPGPPPPAPLGFDTEPAHWFLDANEIAAARGNVDLLRTLSVFTAGNLAESKIDGESYMQALHNDLARTGAGDFFHLTAWRLNITQDLIPPATSSPSSPSRFDNLIRAAAGRGMVPSALIWKAVAAGFTPSSVGGMVGENTTARNFFNSVGGRGVIDGRYPAAGSHHQKTAVVVRAGEAVAYCGGIDVCPDRWDNPPHRSDARRTPEVYVGWHDVHLRLRGPAVLDIERNFRDRWNEPETPSLVPPEPSPPPITSPLPPVATSPGTHNIQVLRTYACIPDRSLLTPTNHYNAFAPRGETTILAGYLKAIARARNYIYIEDQYLVSEELAIALGRALNTANKLIILVPRETDGFPVSAFNFHQDQFLRIVRAGHPAKVHIFHPLQPTSGSPIYVHSKVMIIDDVYAVIGSPNVNRRGSSHDTELAAAVVDSDVVNGACRFARDFRQSLWGEHLGIPALDPRIADPIVGVGEWERQAAAGTFRVRTHVTPAPQKEFRRTWDTAADPDGRCTRAGAPPARLAISEAEVDSSDFVEAADLILTESAGESSPDSLLHDVLSQTGLIWALALPETGRLPTLAEIFDAFVYGRDVRMREQLGTIFEVLALPSHVLDRDLDEGDVLIHRGQGDSTQVALIASPTLLDLDGVATAGLTPDVSEPGKFAHVVEAGTTPHTLDDAFARRITDPESITPPGALLLRIRMDAAPRP
jgi:phosphatidylserine/phosphatidylglycerophosphate/cardiolipin synthase-like enzyme